MKILFSNFIFVFYVKLDDVDAVIGNWVWSLFLKREVYKMYLCIDLYWERERGEKSEKQLINCWD